MSELKVNLALEAGILARESKRAATKSERKGEIRYRIGEICKILQITRKELFEIDHQHGGHPKYGRTKRIRDGEDSPPEHDDLLLNADGTEYRR